MNSHIEIERLLKLGNKTYDVSNVSYLSKVKAMRVWDSVASKEEITASELDNMVIKVGLMLIRQSIEILMFRMGFFQAVKSYISRRFITRRRIKRLSLKQYEDFEDFVYSTLTGDKKKDLEVDQVMLKSIRELFIKMQTEMKLNPDQCLELLMTFVRDRAKL